MNSDLAKRQRQAVKNFYEIHGASFGRTRGFTWEEEKLVAGRIQPGMTILDIGAGNGRFAKLVPEHANYIGIEPSSSLRANADPDLDIRDGALPDLKQIPDQTADITICFAVFHHLPAEDRQRSMKELIRMTKAGGLIAATAWIPTQFLPSDFDGQKQEEDLLIPWEAEGSHAERYVHVFSMKEWTELWNDSELIIEHIGMFGKSDWATSLSEARNWFAMAKRK
ncbi:MAG TPA: class I SAM-dependent methyltransferase [Patescibacteria group bacterium]|nr:class I SAM-dependent methyltransferase [Patescibacteria group bacterium]